MPSIFLLPQTALIRGGALINQAMVRMILFVTSLASFDSQCHPTDLATRECKFCTTRNQLNSLPSHYSERARFQQLLIFGIPWQGFEARLQKEEISVQA
jgi:hypothetical protein